MDPNKKIKYTNEQELKHILQLLKEQFGISNKLNGNLLRIGTERIRLFTGELTEKQLKKLQENVRIEGIGLYFAKEQKEQIRLSIEGSQIAGPLTTKNTYELTNEQVQQWMEGSDLIQTNPDNNWVIITHKSDFLGTGKKSAEKIGNYIPKPRRLKVKE